MTCGAIGELGRIGWFYGALRLWLTWSLEHRGLDHVLEALGRKPGVHRMGKAAGRLGPRRLATTLAVLSATERVMRRLTPLPDTCLYRALARFGTLSWSGVDEVVFVMGVRGREPNLDFHAWVEVDAAPVLEHQPVGDFHPILRHGPRGGWSSGAEAR